MSLHEAHWLAPLLDDLQKATEREGLARVSDALDHAKGELAGEIVAMVDTANATQAPCEERRAEG